MYNLGKDGCFEPRSRGDKFNTSSPKLIKQTKEILLTSTYRHVKGFLMWQSHLGAMYTFLYFERFISKKKKLKVFCLKVWKILPVSDISWHEKSSGKIGFSEPSYSPPPSHWLKFPDINFDIPFLVVPLIFMKRNNKLNLILLI